MPDTSPELMAPDVDQWCKRICSVYVQVTIEQMTMKYEVTIKAF